MMSLTDLLILICSILFILFGALRGFLRSLVGPVAFILGTAAGIIYYVITHNSFVALLISILAPLVLTWIFSFLFGIIFPNFTQKISPLSRFGGALVTFIWGMCFVLPVVVFLYIASSLVPWMSGIHNDVARSCSYQSAKPLAEWMMPSLKTKSAPPSTSQNKSTSNLEDLSKDPRIVAVYQDPEIQKAIEHKDYGALMSNPKIMTLTQEVMKDPALLKKMMDASQEAKKKTTLP